MLSWYGASSWFVAIGGALTMIVMSLETLERLKIRTKLELRVDDEACYNE